MSEQDNGQIPTLQRPTTDNREKWRIYWEQQGQPWRTEAEIDGKRQDELARRRTIVPDIETGIYPFKEIKLSRADVEWLLATHESSGLCGPVNWKHENQRDREGLDLRGADLRDLDLHGLPLANLRVGLDWRERVLKAHKVAACLERADLHETHLEGASLEGICMDGVNLRGAYMQEAKLDGTNLRNAKLSGTYLEKASLGWANLERADLQEAYLQKASFDDASLKGADLIAAHLEEANLCGASLERAFLYNAHLEGANLNNAMLAGAYLSNTYFAEAELSDINLVDEKGTGPRLSGIYWGNANLTEVKWSQIRILGEEYDADNSLNWDKEPKYRDSRLTDYEKAVRAYRQLAVALQVQGMNEDATIFAYRGQLMQRKVFWYQMLQYEATFKERVHALRAWLFSWTLFLVAGYGYRPGRSLITYLAIVLGFATVYYLLGQAVGPHLSPLGSFVFSMTSFHGRGFFPGGITLDDPLTVLAALEAFVGLLIEVTFIATLTQRLFGK